MRVNETAPPSPASSAPPPASPAAEARAALAELFPRWDLGQGEHAPELTRAIQDFQRQRGLDPSGVPDRATLDELVFAVDQRRYEVSLEDAADDHSITPLRGAPIHTETNVALLQRELAARPAIAPARERPFEIEPRALTRVERLALDAFLAQPQIKMFRDIAVATDRTIVLGVGVDAGAGARGFGSVGLYFGPNGEIGFTGAGGAGAAMQLGASATYQVTVLDGGIDLLEGSFVMMGGSVGLGLVTGGVAGVLDASTGDPIGFSLEVGVGVSGFPVELYFQHGVGGRTDPINRRPE